MLNIISSKAHAFADWALPPSKTEDKKLSDSIVSRIFRSPLLRASALTSLAVAFGVQTARSIVQIPSGNSLGNVTTNALLTLGFGVAAKKYKEKFRKEIKHEWGTTRNVFQFAVAPKQYPWWTSVLADNRLFVGAIPLENKGHRQQLEALGVTHFVSVVENQEFNSELLTVPMRFSKNSENWYSLPMADHGTTDDLPKVMGAVNWIKSKVESGGKVYVHCKSGKGRSVLTAAIFMILHGAKYDSRLQAILARHEDKKEKVEAVISYMKSLRPQLNPSKDQKQTIVDCI